jgi:hypothetical protein
MVASLTIPLELLTFDNQPFLILGGETGNSAASDISEMNTWWPKIKNKNRQY